MTPILAAGPSLYWYLTRSTGAVALLLLTVAIVLGVVDVRRFSTPHWPRFVVDALHRNVSLLAMVFLVLHILTSVLDTFAPISLIDAVVPFAGSYRPFWLGLGAVAFDLLLAVTITSLLRQRMGYAQLARDPLADLRELADRAAARVRHRQRRQQHVAACAQRRMPGWRCSRRCSCAWPPAGPSTWDVAAPRSAAPGCSRCSCCSGCPADRSARNGRGARAPRPRCCSHSGTSSGSQGSGR